MTELEQRINSVLGILAPQNKMGKALSGIKKTLKSSSHIVDAVNNIGENLQENLEDEVGGITGTVGGWVAGKTIKIGGGLVGGIVAGTLKTVADIIPDSSDIKLPESDAKIAHCIDTYPIPTDKDELFNLLQFTWNSINSKSTPYGKQTLDSLKRCHSKIHSAFIIAAEGDKNLLDLSKPFAHKKRFGLF